MNITFAFQIWVILDITIWVRFGITILGQIWGQIWDHNLGQIWDHNLGQIWGQIWTVSEPAASNNNQLDIEHVVDSGVGAWNAKRQILTEQWGIMLGQAGLSTGHSSYVFPHYRSHCDTLRHVVTLSAVVSRDQEWPCIVQQELLLVLLVLIPATRLLCPL